jgi:circadian clock protein KaiC
LDSGTKLETGIEGLDQILNGGIPEKNQVLIAGGPGTGKTLMAFELVYNCAKRGIPSAFISLDEKSNRVLKNVKSTFPYMTSIDELIRNKLLIIDGDDTSSKIATNTNEESGYSMGNMMAEAEGIIKTVEAQVAVIDSLSFLKLMLGKTLLYNKSVSSLISNLRRADVTGIITLELPYYQKERMKFGQELLLFDGVMAMYHEGDYEKKENVMEVVKMRGNGHQDGLHHYDITEQGVKFK